MKAFDQNQRSGIASAGRSQRAQRSVRGFSILSPIAALLALTLAAPPTAEAQPCTGQSLRWMQGTWLLADDPGGGRETWAIAPEGVIMGNAWDFPKGNTAFAELATIRHEHSGILMKVRHFDVDLSHAREGVDAPLTFAATHCGTTTVTFEGRGKGGLVTYTRFGDKLSIVVHAARQDAHDHKEWHLVLQK